MAYVPLTTQVANGDILASWANQVKDNFAAGVPDIFTTKGDIAVASGGDTASRLSVGSDYQVLQSLASETLGLQYSSGIYSICQKSGAQSIATATMTKIPIASAISDVYSMLDVVNSRLTIPVGFPTRHYLIMAQGYWSATGTANKYRHIEIQVSGTAYTRQSSVGDDATEAIGCSTLSIATLAAGSYIEVWVKQDSGGNLNFNDTRLGLFMIR